jgi:hypothetical protein
MNIDFTTKFHRDGSITYWDVYKQRWHRTHSVTEKVLATLPESERKRILKRKAHKITL